jgi:hypothetical protein
VKEMRLRDQDPYASLPREKKTCTSMTISDADRAFLLGVHPDQSVVQISANILLSRWVAALKECGIDQYNPERYRRALAS